MCAQRNISEDTQKMSHSWSNLTGVFVVRMKRLCILRYRKYVLWRFWSDCANARADLNLCWVNMLQCAFSDVAAHMSLMLTLKALSKIIIYDILFFITFLRKNVLAFCLLGRLFTRNFKHISENTQAISQSRSTTYPKALKEEKDEERITTK